MSSVTMIEIPGSASLDQIDVYFKDVTPGVGQITITCWGSAWTCYFGGMSGKTIAQFVASCDVPYLVGKMGNTQHLKGTKKDLEYLGRLITAVKAELEAQKAAGSENATPGVKTNLDRGQSI